jgi:hypothetical protein
MAKKDKIKRTMRLHKTDGTYVDLNIVAATAIHSDIGMLHLDKLPSGDFRLIISDDIIEDMTTFKSMEMIRER